jgi:hypothetical protein
MGHDHSATQARLRRLRAAYRRLSRSAQVRLISAALTLSQGEHPPRVWVFLDGTDGRDRPGPLPSCEA